MPTNCCAKCAKPNAKKQCCECKVVVYCSKRCQLEHWKEHKGSCCTQGGKLLDKKALDKIAYKLIKLQDEKQWTKIISQVKYLEQLLLEGDHVYYEKILDLFSTAYHHLNSINKDKNHVTAFIRLDMRRANNFGILRQFEKQGILLVRIGFACYNSNRHSDAVSCFEKAHTMCQHSHSLSVEVESMVGLAIMCLEKGMVTSVAGNEREDGLNILRSATFAAGLITDNTYKEQFFAQRNLLIYLLAKDDTLEEAEQYLKEFSVRAYEMSAHLNILTVAELHTDLLTAQLHQMRREFEKFDDVMFELFDKIQTRLPTDRNIATRMVFALEESKGVAEANAFVSKEVLNAWECEIQLLEIVAGNVCVL